ncbi:MAG: TetR family transcriptional regulator [Actinobacteria bacterium]|nr:TetR family transcriptional regulator [Actinomycetota bacterium]
MSTSPDQDQESPARPGLRERKKARTRAAIRQQALRLFREQGYDATTVEQIAEAAEVSPSTFFRYFPTKEDVVLQDDMDLRWAAAYQEVPAGLTPLAALRAALRKAMGDVSAEELAQFQQSAQLSITVPAVRARALDEFGRSVQIVSAMMGERAGREPDDPAVRTLAGAVIGVVMATWFGSGGDMQRFTGELDRALSLLEAGLPL